MRAFLSYQTDDKAVAGAIKQLLDLLSAESFLAHEDIEVSAEWRLVIIQELMAADLFIPILSKNYYNSIWCKQENREWPRTEELLLSLYRLTARYHKVSSHIYSRRKSIRRRPSWQIFLPGLAKRDVKFVIDGLIPVIAKSGSYRGAEASFELILPYLSKATKEQIVGLLNASIKNDQICHASLCATKYLPPLFQSHGKFMANELRNELAGVLKQYESVKR